jgi:hypothetical protein
VSGAPAHGSIVPLPEGAGPPFEVYVNGVLQAEGHDYVVEGGSLRFARRLVPPRPTTARFLARLMVAGRYKPEHTVDLVYRSGGRREMAHRLPIRDAGGDS